MRHHAAIFALFIMSVSGTTAIASPTSAQSAAVGLLQRADRCAFDAKQYRAAGKPASQFKARYYDSRALAYRSEALTLQPAR